MKRGIFLFVLLAGCAQFDTGSVALQSLATELDCPQSRVEVTQVGAYRYRGEGCGRDSEVVCTASRLEPQCLASVTAGGAQVAGEDDPRDNDADTGPDTGPDTGREPPPTESTALADAPDADVEARIRAGLDARSDDVLACAGRDRVAVRAGYAPDGSVAFSLQGDLSGTPEERCVQDALDGLRVAATGEAAVVIHLVR